MASIENHCIAGTRISIWDVLHHLESGCTIPEIADVFNLSSTQVESALDYISEHEGEVRRIHRQIEQRNTVGNTPDVESKLAKARAKRLAWQAERQPIDTQELHCVGNRT